MGRPAFEITDEIIEEVERLASRGLTMDEICLLIGCSRSTLKRAKRKNQKLNEVFNRGVALSHSEIANALYENAMGGSFQAQAFFLTRRHGAKWRSIDKPEPQVSEMTEEEVDHELELIRRSREDNQTL